MKDHQGLWWEVESPDGCYRVFHEEDTERYLEEFWSDMTDNEVLMCFQGWLSRQGQADRHSFPQFIERFDTWSRSCCTDLYANFGRDYDTVHDEYYGETFVIIEW